MKRCLATAMLAITIAAIPFISSGCGTSMIDGVVDHKAITGILGNDYHSILLNRPAGEMPWILVKDNVLPDHLTFAEHFNDSDKNAVISQSLAEEMGLYYHEIHYWVSVLSNDGESVKTYEVDRETFNRMEIGDSTRN
jgi:hypothetical protein